MSANYIFRVTVFSTDSRIIGMKEGVTIQCRALYLVSAVINLSLEQVTAGKKNYNISP
jgi:hypothetical protein